MACSFCIHLKTPCFNALGSCGLNGRKSYAKRKSLILLKQNCTQQFAVGGETHCLLRLRLPVDTSLPHREQTSQTLHLPRDTICYHGPGIVLEKNWVSITAQESFRSIRNIAAVNHRDTSQLGTKLKWLNNPHQVLPCLVHKPFFHVENTSGPAFSKLCSEEH